MGNMLLMSYGLRGYINEKKGLDGILLSVYYTSKKFLLDEARIL
jgi:hypothetical protein